MATLMKYRGILYMAAAVAVVVFAPPQFQRNPFFLAVHVGLFAVGAHLTVRQLWYGFRA